MKPNNNIIDVKNFKVQTKNCVDHEKIQTNIKGNWISDKARFAYDGLVFQRLTENLIRVTDKFSVCNWLSDAYRIDTKQTITSAFLVGGLLGIEETQRIFALVTEYANKYILKK